jgi:hypothetical protein
MQAVILTFAIYLRKPAMQKYLTKEEILERIQALPKKSKYLTREEINQRINLACELGLFTKNPMRPKNALRS